MCENVDGSVMAAEVLREKEVYEVGRSVGGEQLSELALVARRRDEELPAKNLKILGKLRVYTYAVHEFH